MVDFERRFLEFTNAEFRMEQDGDKGIRLMGHAAVYNSFSEPIPFKTRSGSYREIIRPGAFDRCLGTNPDVRLLTGHEGLPLARTASGTLSLKADARGLAFDAHLDPSDPDCQRLLPKLRRKDLSAMSFAFRCFPDGDDWRTEPQMGQIRELRDVDISDGDISIVTYPSYVATDVALRSLERFEQRMKDAQKVEITDTPIDVLRARLDLLAAE